MIPRKPSTNRGPLHQWNETFALERAQFALKFCCEECVHFVASDESCAHLYPNELHKKSSFERGAAKYGTFCKEFELQ